MRTRAEIEQGVVAIVRDVISPIDGATPENLRDPDSRLREDLLFDSLDTVELAMSLEEEYGLECGDDLDDGRIWTLRMVFDEVERRLAAKESA